MTRKPLAAAAIAAASALALLPGTSHAGHEPAVGALVGATFGAALGHGLGGHEGALVGGVLGAITGASLAAEHRHVHYDHAAPVARYPAAPVYYAPPPVVYRAPPVVVYPARPVRPVYAPVVVVRPGHGRSDHRTHGRWR